MREVSGELANPNLTPRPPSLRGEGELNPLASKRRGVFIRLLTIISLPITRLNHLRIGKFLSPIFC